MSWDRRIAIAVGGLSIAGAVCAGVQKGRRTVDAWAQAAEERVQRNVEAKIDSVLGSSARLEANQDRIVCAVVHSRPRAVCDCEFYESQQKNPRPERCATAERLYEAGRDVEAAEVAENPDP